MQHLILLASLFSLSTASSGESYFIHFYFLWERNNIVYLIALCITSQGSNACIFFAEFRADDGPMDPFIGHFFVYYKTFILIFIVGLHVFIFRNGQINEIIIH